METCEENFILHQFILYVAMHLVLKLIILHAFVSTFCLPTMNYSKPFISLRI